MYTVYTCDGFSYICMFYQADAFICRNIAAARDVRSSCSIQTPVVVSGAAVCHCVVLHVEQHGLQGAHNDTAHQSPLVQLPLLHTLCQQLWHIPGSEL